MALQNQFVTSFSELYIRTGAFTDANGLVISGTGAGFLPSAESVRDWFVDDGIGTTEKVVTLTIAGTVANNDEYVVTLGGVDFTATVPAAGTVSPTTLATQFRTLIGNNANYTVGTGNAGIITITGVDAGDYSTVFSATVGSATGIFVVTTPFVQGVGATIEIPLVMEIGTLSNEATIIDVPTFGEEFRGKLRGQLDGGQLDVQLYWAPREAVHLAIRQFAQRGTAVSVGIRWRPTSDAAAADTELVVFDSFVSSFGIDTTFDDVAKVSATMVVDGAEHFASGDPTVNTL